MGHAKKEWRNWGDHPFVVVIGTLAGIAVIIGLVITVWELSKSTGKPSTPPQLRPMDPDSRDRLRSKLVKYLHELDEIEANWDKKYALVEALAERAASVLAQYYPKSASAITDVRRLASAASEVAHVMRREIQIVLDQLDVEKPQ